MNIIFFDNGAEKYEQYKESIKALLKHTKQNVFKKLIECKLAGQLKDTSIITDAIINNLDIQKKYSEILKDLTHHEILEFDHILQIMSDIGDISPREANANFLF